MQRKVLVLTLMLAILITASVVILLVDFGIKERKSSKEQVAAPQEGANVPPPLPKVDGIIERAEYDHHYRSPEISMDLYWTIAEEEGSIYFGLSSPSSGWVAISIAPTGPRMKGGDVLIGYVKEGEIQVRDDYADVVSHTSDLELDGTYDILESAGSSGPEGTTIEFKRLLITEDRAYDKEIRPGIIRVQLAYSECANFDCFHDENWTIIDVDFYSGEVRQVASPQNESGR